MLCSRHQATLLRLNSTPLRFNSRMLKWILASIVPVALFAQAPEPAAEAKREFFENNIRPVLVQNCATCHNDTRAGGLRLASREDLLKGGASGPALVPGDPEKKRSGFADLPDRCGETNAARWSCAEGSRRFEHRKVGERWSVLA